MSSFIPETAPFNQEQRAWLNGFFSGLMGMQGVQETQGVQGADAGGMLTAAGLDSTALPLPTDNVAAEVLEEDYPWHDESIELDERLEMAKDRPVERKLMAAMAQLDCGSCGYLCKTYAEAIASGDEKNLTLCSPGGKETKQAIKRLLKANDGAASDGAATNGSVATIQGAASGVDLAYSRNYPFAAKLLESRPLNKEGSAKDTRHVVIDLSGSGLKYEVGDALGIYPKNCGELVAMIVDRIGADPNVPVTTPTGGKSLREALMDDYCLKDPSDELIELVLPMAGGDAAEALKTMLDDGVPEGFDVLDVLELAETKSITATEFLETLDPLNPRLYSIASSMKRVGDEVHLTVGKVTYEREGRIRKGAASTMLADRVAEGETVRVFTQANHGGFTVPSDPSTPMIMVGPGTGIAPFVAFLQERDASGCTGEDWLFFGDQHEAFDFLYEDQLQSYVDSGRLKRLDTAFSRDGDKKVYVQDRMRENAAELWQWIERGAHFYVCGDATRMAADVDRALRYIIEQQGGMSAEEAGQYVKRMTDEKRYVRDVY